ncbi:MAG: hypothetical protein JXR94_04080 [Candidatus Hydrogenedentes bacterium]|nr:hypothetical protein [Candidatus Hydrogenedentota bacterium]
MAVLGVAAGLMFARAFVAPAQRSQPGGPEPDAGAGKGEPTASPATGSVGLGPDSVAMRYARAVCNGDADEVIALTLWMQERLRRAALEADDAAARAKLKEAIVERAVEGHQLHPEGVADQYVFTPGASLTPLGVDEGRTDLARPADHRVWIRVTYPTPAAALRDSRGHPIRSLAVGVNVSKDGYVLKAGIIGNLDIDHGSVMYDWP